MTIKKRSARSNIVMLVIPVLGAAVLGVVIGVLTFRCGGRLLAPFNAARKAHRA